mmetsp:Transcript_13536/g.38392  ORF Transcript_13536/g.38392 Transcript_13536/m.38392 type:complete len:203 (-) Transcript_13536:590-1198(-)
MCGPACRGARRPRPVRLHLWLESGPSVCARFRPYLHMVLPRSLQVRARQAPSSRQRQGRPCSRTARREQTLLTPCTSSPWPLRRSQDPAKFPSLPLSPPQRRLAPEQAWTPLRLRDRSRIENRKSHHYRLRHRSICTPPRHLRDRWCGRVRRHPGPSPFRRRWRRSETQRKRAGRSRQGSTSWPRSWSMGAAVAPLCCRRRA